MLATLLTMEQVLQSQFSILTIREVLSFFMTNENCISCCEPCCMTPAKVAKIVARKFETVTRFLELTPYRPCSTSILYTGNKETVPDAV